MLYLLLGIILGTLIYYKIIKPANYWQRKGVTHESAWPLIGNMGSSLLGRKHMVHIINDIYKKFPNERYVGFMQFTQKILILRDLHLIKQIGVKDFDHFHDHSNILNNEKDPLLSKSLVMLHGEKWRQMRGTLSPAFTSNKMKNMYHLMAECAENFVGYFRGKEQVAVEMKDLFRRFATDVIATTAFGIKVDSMAEPKNDFFKMGISLSTFSIFQIIRLFILMISSTLAKLLNIQLFPKGTTNFFRSIVKDNIAKRIAQGIVRPDLIHLLMEARKGQLNHETDQNPKEGFAIVEESTIAQSMLFFLAGFDTVSAASCFMAHELAVNPDIQKKLQNEIDQVNRNEEKVSYEALLSMKYLDQVVCETLRMWSPGFLTDRLCTKDYVIEPKNPNEKKLVIEKGISVMFPLNAIQRDPKYFPDPDRFDPERFSDRNKGKILPWTYLPFGIGPRNCIGSRFALLEIKTLFFHLLSKFDIVPINKTEIPIKISAKKLNFEPENGFNLGLRPRPITNN